jgi:alpha-glucosidase
VTWWERAVIYNTYPRSWKDSDGDGIGDLRGILERLDHLEWLGVDAVWLNPIFPSPNRDWGYDVSDYLGVHPEFGTLDDLDVLIAEARRRRIAIVLDVVPSHTSDEHPWFRESRQSRSSRLRDYYVWRRGRSNGEPPTNWCNYVGEVAWMLDERTNEYYLHNFTMHQPQLNWWNSEVVAEFDRVFRFWFERGVAGFRIDALQTLFFDTKLRDNPMAGTADTEKERALGQSFAFNANRPEVHDIIRHWRTLADDYDPPRLLFGETWVPTIESLAAFYGNGHDELHLAWNLPFLASRFDAGELAGLITRTIEALPSDAVPSWAISTHDDQGRAASRWCAGHDAAVRCSLLLLLGLPGTSILYYGDEIGMVEPRVELNADDRYLADERLASRTPMQWARGPGVGFTTGLPWLPVGDPSRANVEDQRNDRASLLYFCRDLIEVRKQLPPQPMRAWSADGSLLTWRCGDAVLAVNIGDTVAEVAASGTVAISTNRDRDGERVSRRMRLGAYEGAIIR